MATEAEELEAKEFLKRAEIRTMRKDLLALREVDALTERDKIAHIKTFEEQLKTNKVEYNVCVNPQEYIKSMFYINREIEKINEEIFKENDKIKKENNIINENNKKLT